MRVLLDHSVPRGLRTVLAGVEVRHAFEMGWHELRNGDLLRAAEQDGFDVLVTSDKNIRHQIRLGGLRIAILELGTNHWPTLRGSIGLILETLGLVTSGSYHEVAVERPSRRRRPPPVRPET